MMNGNRTNRRGKALLRRVAACALAVLALWMLSLSSSGGLPFQLFSQLGGSARFVTGALAAQISSAGTQEREAEGALWQQLLGQQSPLLADWGEKQTRQALTTRPAQEDEEEALPLAPASGEIIERFFQPLSSEIYEQAQGVYILNRTEQELDMAQLAAAQLNICLQEGQPQILIMHTHGSEAYAQEGKNVYQETDTARTTDTQYNIIRVGDEIERIFTEMGLSVLHDRSLYDYPYYNGSYERSRAAVEQYLAEYPSIQIVLDIHRDALIGEDGTVYKAVTEIDGEKVAQVLLVLGSDDGGARHDHWRQNLSLAMHLEYRMNTLWPGLARPIVLRSSRFNQQLTEGSILVEVGSHGNSLDEALRGARHFARAAGQVFLELKE